MIIAWAVVGAVMGVVWERFSTTYSPNKDRSTLFPSLIIRRNNKSLHLHHWLFYFACVLTAIIWSLSKGRYFSPLILAVDSFFLAAMLYNFRKYPDWYRFWY